MKAEPLVGLVMIVKDEERVISRCLRSVKPLIDTWTICDTGSSDETQAQVEAVLDGVPGRLLKHSWRNYGSNLNLAFGNARGSATWLLHLDADFTVEAHEGLRDWLATDPDPAVDAWMVEIEDSGTIWRVPRLVRGDHQWSFVGAVHEYLNTAERVTRPLLGLTLRHHADGSDRGMAKLNRWLDLLTPGFEKGDPRDTFYYAETLRFLGRTTEAIAAYEVRADMTEIFPEEAWYARYQAARLRADPARLVAAWAERPWRHEPLTHAARIVSQKYPDAQGDVLFLEQFR